MVDNKSRLMTKSKIASHLGISTEDIHRWADFFESWLDACPRRTDKLHDQDDVLVFTLISKVNQQIEDDVPFLQRIKRIECELNTLDWAFYIKEKRRKERERPEIARWQMVSTDGVCLRYDYEWLTPLRPFVVNIAGFGCWASSPTAGTCSEPYALLWTLEAARVVVIDKGPDHIRNAQEWLDTTREKHSYFKDYNLEFVVGDMTDKRLTERVAALDENGFDLSYCKDVLYNMHPYPNELQDSIDALVKVVKPGGWVIAVEPKIEDISKYFEAVGLTKFSLDKAPNHSYCYQKPE